MLVSKDRSVFLLLMALATTIAHGSRQCPAAESPDERLSLSTQRVVVFKDVTTSLSNTG